MPLSTTLFLYSLSIVVGVILVAFGLLRDPRRKAPETALCEEELLCELPCPSPEPVPLQFKEEGTGLEDRGLQTSVPDAQDVPLAWHSGSADPSKASFRRVLGAPFSWLHRKNPPPDAESSRLRTVETTLLAPKQQKPPQEPGDAS